MSIEIKGNIHTNENAKPRWARVYVPDPDLTIRSPLACQPGAGTSCGNQIAFQTKRDGNWEIYLMNADGTNVLNLTNNPADDQLPYWRPAWDVPPISF